MSGSGEQGTLPCRALKNPSFIRSLLSKAEEIANFLNT